MSMTFRATALILLSLLLPFTGCVEKAPKDDAMPPVVLPPEPVRLPGHYPSGVEVHYSLAPTYNEAHRVHVDLRIRLAADRSVAIAYTHPDRPAFDSTLNGILAADGSWERLDFACEPRFPDDRNTGGCNKDRGGYGQSLGLDGPFFGYLMLAGLQVADNGTVHRAFRIGTQSTTVWFAVESGPDRFTIRPANPASRGLVSGFGHSNQFDPLHCTIFNGEITVQRHGGIPTGCVMIEPDETFPVWNLATQGLVYDAEFLAQPGEPQPSGNTKWPRQGNGSLPFGLVEALDAARARDERIAEALDNPETWLGTSSFSRSGGSAPGVCPLCLQHEEWSWSIRLETPQDRLSFSVRKVVDGLLGTSYELTAEGPEPQDTFPDRFPVRIEAFEAIWAHATALVGFEPAGLGYQMPYGPGREFIALTGATEPMFTAIFSNEQGQGYAPAIYYRADGTLELFMANGAVPTQR